MLNVGGKRTRMTALASLLALSGVFVYLPAQAAGLTGDTLDSVFFLRPGITRALKVLPCHRVSRRTLELLPQTERSVSPYQMIRSCLPRPG